MKDYNEFDDFEMSQDIDDLFDSDDELNQEEDDSDDQISELDIVDILRNELIKAEPDRNSVMFKISGDYKNEYEGVPLKELPDQNAFIFKLLPNGNLKKIKLDNIEFI